MSTEAVVLVHGLWMTGLESAVLRHRLRESGYRAEQFSYSTLRGTLATTARRLREFIDAVDADAVHLIAHSLGGLVALELLERGGTGRPGRIVLLGSPVRGSVAARGLSRLPLGEFLLGSGMHDALMRFEGRSWEGSNPIGTIAGTLGFGPGHLVSDLPEPNDGTVAVVETRLPGEVDHIELPVTHAGLLFSKAVAEQVVHFLHDGRFEHRADAGL